MDGENLLQGGSQEEMSVCPRCHESVPRTLYCLNCGYPLYREEKEIPAVRGLQEQFTGSSEAESKMEIEEAKPPQALEEISMEPQEKMEKGEVEEGFEAGDVKTQETPPATPRAEMEMGVSETLDVSTPESVELPKIEASETPAEAIGVTEERPAELEAVKVEAGGAEEEVMEALKVAEQPSKTMIDPVILEVMENISKNISLKVKLIELAMKGEVKENTLKKLLENYAAKGEIWINRRNEILERGRYEISTLERALENVRAGLEELEIRRAIGDASDDEYAAKAPSYEWDLNHLNEKLTRKKLEIAYLESLSKVMPVDDFESLKAIASSCHHDIDELASTGRVSPETATEIRSILEEALELLKD